MLKTSLKNILLNQELAVGNYLDQLLHEATLDSSEPEAEQKIVPLVQEAKPIASGEPVVEIDEPQPVITDHSDVQVEQVEVHQPEAVSESNTLEPGLFPLQCLTFRVAGNLLAMPLIRMKSVVPWPQNLTHLPQSPDGVLGMFTFQDHNVQIVDSSSVLGIKPAADSTSSHVLVLGDNQWAITCDKLENLIRLEYSDIQWCKKQGESMIFGTIRDSLASLLNPDGIVNSFKASKIN